MVQALDIFGSSHLTFDFNFVIMSCCKESNGKDWRLRAGRAGPVVGLQAFGCVQDSATLYRLFIGPHS